MTMLKEVALVLNGKVDRSRTHCFRRWDDSLLAIYHRIEERSFSRELVYTREELLKRQRNTGFEGLIQFVDNRATAVLMIYDDAEPGVIYIDTLAVASPGRGIGRALLEALISVARGRGYRGLTLDTEWINEQGQQLVDFYRRFGFTAETAEGEGGNIHLVCRFSGRPSAVPVSDPSSTVV